MNPLLAAYTEVAKQRFQTGSAVRLFFYVTKQLGGRHEYIIGGVANQDMTRTLLLLLPALLLWGQTANGPRLLIRKADRPARSSPLRRIQTMNARLAA